MSTPDLLLRTGPCLFYYDDWVYYDDWDDWMQACLRASADPLHVMHDGRVHWQNDICVQDYAGDKGERRATRAREATTQRLPHVWNCTDFIFCCLAIVRSELAKARDIPAAAENNKSTIGSAFDRSIEKV